MYGMSVPVTGAAGGPPPVSFDLPKNVYRFGEQTLWSTQLFQSGAGGLALAQGTFRLFTTPLGQVGQGFTNALSIAETNLKEGGRIPSGIAFDCFGIAAQQIQFDGNVDNATAGTAVNNDPNIGNLLNIQHNGIISWDFTQTQVDVCPVMLAGSGGGAFGTLAASDIAGGNATTGNVNNGNGSVWLYRKHPVALPGNSTFSITLRFGSRAAAVAIGRTFAVRVVLLGYYKNVIEIA